MEAPKSSEDNGALVVKMENKETRRWVGIANRMSLETLLSSLVISPVLTLHTGLLFVACKFCFWASDEYG